MGGVPVKTDQHDRIVNELLALLSRLSDDKFTGSLSLTIRLNQGGVTAAALGNERSLFLK